LNAQRAEVDMYRAKRPEIQTIIQKRTFQISS